MELSIGVVNAGASSIDQRLVFVGREDGKLLAIRQLIQQGQLKPPVLLFLQNKERAKELYRELVWASTSMSFMAIGLSSRGKMSFGNFDKEKRGCSFVLI